MHSLTYTLCCAPIKRVHHFALDRTLEVPAALHTRQYANSTLSYIPALCTRRLNTCVTGKRGYQQVDKRERKKKKTVCTCYQDCSSSAEDL